MRRHLANRRSYGPVMRRKSLIGDIIRDPFKDTPAPRLNILIVMTSVTVAFSLF